MKPNSVVMLIQNFYPAIGGAERQAFELSQALVKKGFGIQVVTRNLGTNPRSEVLFGVSIRRLFCPGPAFFSAIVFMVSSFFYLLFNIRKFDVIHVHLASSHVLPAIIISRVFNKKVLVKFGGGKGIGEVYSSVQTFSGRLKLSFLRMMRPTLVIVSQEQMEELKKQGIDPSTVHEIPNGVDTEKFQPSNLDERKSLRAQLKLSGTVFLFVGRFASDKLRMDVFTNLMEAWKKVVEHHSDAQLLFIGKGPLQPSYEKLINELNLTSSIKFLGVKNNVSDYYKAVDCFVLPSLAEGLSNALLEAMACGLTSVASRVSGIDNMIQEGKHGYLFNPFKADEITKAFQLFFEKSSERSQMARDVRLLSESYSLNQTANRYADIYLG